MQVRLIEDLLDMSRILAGTLRVDIQSVDAAGFIQAALDTVGPAANAQRLRIETLWPDAPAAISGDPTRLQQVMINLLSNAIKFTPAGGTIRVLVERVEPQLEIRVSDDGIGIEPDFIPHLFERFRQADGMARRHGGLGISLSIVKQLVELHGGTISASAQVRVRARPSPCVCRSCLESLDDSRTPPVLLSALHRRQTAYEIG
jgi:signal transduction histidine kinase